MRLKATAPLRRRRGPIQVDSGMPDVAVIARQQAVARDNRTARRSAAFTLDDLCAAWIEGFQAQFVLAFRDGYAAGERGRRPEPGNHSLPDRKVVTALVCHVLGLPLVVTREDGYGRAVLSKAYKDGEREGRRIGYAFGWKGSQTEMQASIRLQRQWDRGRDGSEADLRALGDGTTTGAARRMMLPARFARNLGVTWKLPARAGGE